MLANCNILRLRRICTLEDGISVKFASDEEDDNITGEDNADDRLVVGEEIQDDGTGNNTKKIMLILNRSNDNDNDNDDGDDDGDGDSGDVEYMIPLEWIE